MVRVADVLYLSLILGSYITVDTSIFTRYPHPPLVFRYDPSATPTITIMVAVVVPTSDALQSVEE